MMYLVQGWKADVFTGAVVPLSELVDTMNAFDGCSVFMLRVNETPIRVHIETSFYFGVYVYDRYNNIMEMHFHNGTEE